MAVDREHPGKDDRAVRAGTGRRVSSAEERTGRRESVSACIITRNEERRLPRCLASLSWCDEVVVVDSGSEDATIELARRAGAKVVENSWPGFAAQRNVAIDHAGGEWILEVDADEWLSADLSAEIDAFRTSAPAQFDIAVLPMRQSFLGASLGPSAHYPFYRPRLFRRGSYRHDERRAVHEGLSARTRPWVFHADMHHELAESWREALEDMWSYARLESRQVTKATPRMYLRGILIRPGGKFLYQAVLLGGWRDGWRGVVKVALDVAADVVVWLRVLLRRVGARDGEPATPALSHSVAVTSPAPAHYGRRARRVGPLRVAVVGSRARLREGSQRLWLTQAEAAGAWLTVIGDLPDDQPGIRLHHLSRLGPIALMRALDAERQLGPLDAVVAVGGVARRVLSVIPAAVRSYSPVLDSARPAAAVIDELWATRRLADDA